MIENQRVAGGGHKVLIFNKLSAFSALLLRISSVNPVIFLCQFCKLHFTIAKVQFILKKQKMSAKK